jgi:hypothetical protein
VLVSTLRTARRLLAQNLTRPHHALAMLPQGLNLNATRV